MAYNRNIRYPRRWMLIQDCLIGVARLTIENLGILAVWYRLRDREIRIDLLERRFLRQVVNAIEHDPDELSCYKPVISCIPLDHA